MHIADGIFAAEIAVAADAAAVGTLFFLGKKIQADDVPKMGFLASALFVVSLVHFPIAGTSMHLGLYGLAGILLGLRAFPVIFVALLFQSLIFQHGGILSIGLNAINMGVGAFSAYLVWKMSGLPESVRAFLAGFIGIFAAAFLMAVEFELSGYGKGIFYLLYGYALVAVIEGVLTASTVGFFRRINPAILEKKS